MAESAASHSPASGVVPRMCVVENAVAMTASTNTSPRFAATSGDGLKLSETTLRKVFVTSFAGDVEAEAARTK